MTNSRRFMLWMSLTIGAGATVFFSPILWILAQGAIFRETYIIPESRYDYLSIIEYQAATAQPAQGWLWKQYEIPISGYLRTSSKSSKVWHRVKYKVRRSDGVLVDQANQDWDSYYWGGKEVIFRKGIEHKGPSAEELANANRTGPAVMP